jgi:hypothetical protein
MDARPYRARDIARRLEILAALIIITGAVLLLVAGSRTGWLLIALASAIMSARFLSRRLRSSRPW